MAEYDPTARKVVEIDSHYIDFYDIFHDKNFSDSISDMVRILNELRIKHPNGCKFLSDYTFNSDLYVKVERLENDEEYGARMAKYENNRQAKILKQQNAAIKAAQQKVKQAKNEELKHDAEERERELYLALKAKYESI